MSKNDQRPKSNFNYQKLDEFFVQQSKAFTEINPKIEQKLFINPAIKYIQSMGLSRNVKIKTEKSIKIVLILIKFKSLIQ